MTKYNVDGIRSGLHIGVHVTQVTLNAGQVTPLPTTPFDRRKSLSIVNKSGNTIYIGGSDVNQPLHQYPIDNNAEWGVDLSDRVVLYGYCPSTVSGVYVFEVG